MQLLDIFFVISWIIIFLLGLDIARRQKFNALHFLVFLAIGLGLMVFTFFPWALTTLWNIFGLQRGADLLVYVSIIFLIYFVLLLLRKLEDNKEDITKLVREIAIQNAGVKTFDSSEIFIIPAYNEGEVLAETIGEVLDAGFTNIIVVDDGSRDNSRKILADFAGKIIVLHHYKNRGQGAALETWFEYVRRFWGDEWYVVTYDSDGQHDIEDIAKFRAYASEDIDILLGSRFLSESKTNVNLKKKIVLKLGIILTFFLSHIRLSDTHNGYRYIKKTALRDMYITIDGMWHASEIIDIISQKKLRYREVPVHIKYTQYSIAKWQKISNGMNVISRFIWSKFFR